MRDTDPLKFPLREEAIAAVARMYDRMPPLADMTDGDSFVWSEEQGMLVPGSAGGAVVKQALEERTTDSAVLVADAELAVPVPADTWVAFEFGMWFEGDTSVNINFGLVVPAGATAQWREEGGGSMRTESTTHQESTSLGVIGSGFYRGRLDTGAGGTLAIRWAKAFGGVQRVGVYPGSYLTLR